MKLSPFNKQSNKGKQAENIACEFLKKNGLKLIDKNFYSRFGEIDLIMQHENTLVFVEVRYRKNMDFGGAKASITASKQSKVRKTALYYMQTKKGRECNSRIDVVAITETTNKLTETQDQNELDIEWIQNAF